jgi:hypothetical protein
VSIGYNSKSNNTYAYSFGNNCEANASSSFAIGNTAKTSARNSISIGDETVTGADYSVAIGRKAKTTGGASNPDAVAIGYSTTASAQRSVAIGIGAKTTTTGESVNGYNGYNSAFGYSAEASAWYSLSVGAFTKASGIGSAALGYETEATATGAVVLGYNSTASGVGSTALGSATKAIGERSFAAGNGAEAHGDYSTAIGNFVTSYADDEFAIGTWNTSYDPESVSDKRLFVIGNGRYGSPSDAMIVYKSGNTTINGEINSYSGGTSSSPTSAVRKNIVTTLSTYSNDYDQIGIYSQATGLKSNYGYYKAIYGEATGGYQAVGVKGKASGSSGLGNHSYGVWGEASATVNTNYGVYGLANGSSVTNYGVYATANGSNSTNYGIYATASGGSSNYAAYFSGNTKFYGGNLSVYNSSATALTVEAPTSYWAGYFTGDIKVTNDIVYGNSCYKSSDSRLKKNIEPITGALDKVLKLRGVSYYWKTKEEMGADSAYAISDTKKQIGVIAQEVEEEFPEIVMNDEKSAYKAVEYNAIGPILIEAVKELKAEKDELEATVAKQQQEIDELKRMVEELLKK